MQRIVKIYKYVDLSNNDWGYIKNMAIIMAWNEF